MVAGLDGSERAFALVISGVHGMDHFLKRLFPPLIPIWAVAFGFPLWKLGLLLGVRRFGSSVGQAPVGILSDRYDRRYLLPLGIGLIGVGLVGFSAIQSLDLPGLAVTVAGVSVSTRLALMLSTMFVIGIGSSSIHPTGYPLISTNVEGSKKGTVLGMWGSAAKFGDGLAPAAVGALILVAAWQHLLLGFGLVGVGYAAFLFVSLRSFETRPAGDLTDDDPDGGDDDRGTDRRRYVYPLLAVFVYFTVQSTAANGVTVFLPEFITRVYSYSFSVAGVRLTPESTASFYYSGLLIIAGVGQLGTGRLVDRYDSRKVLIGYLLAAAAVLALLSVGAFSPFVLFAVLVGLGVSLYGLNPARDSLLSDIAPAEREGRTFGYIWTAVLMVSSASPVVVGYIGDVAGLRSAFLILAGIILVSTAPLVLLLSDRVYLPPDSASEAGAPHGD